MRLTVCMSSFSYIARTAAGTLEKGSIEASTPEQAREKLRKRQLIVEELKAEESEKPISFAGAMPWTTTDEDAVPVMAAQTLPEDAAEYIPLVDTLRLFAGWLLAWYAVVYLLGSFQLNGKIPYDIPFLQGLFESPVVLRFAFATFLFLMLTNIHTWLGKGAGKGAALGIAGIIVWGLFHLNV